MVLLQHRIAPDLPFNDGLFAPVDVICPRGTIVNADPPAAISAAHMHVGLNAAGVGMQSLTLAIAASPDSPQHPYLGGAGFESAIATQVWSWTDDQGRSDAFIALDGNWVGGSAGAERDGGDLGRNPVGIPVRGAFPDIEVLESWFPLLFTERRTRAGVEGAGDHRAGGGNQFSFKPHGVDEIRGTMFGMRRWLPLQGLAGGMPGACTELLIHRADGEAELLNIHGSGHVARPGDQVQMRLASGGGYGDPLDRDPFLVAGDVADKRFSAEEARAAYGVVLDEMGRPDGGATERAREAMRRDRLDRAIPPLVPLGPAPKIRPSDPGDPHYPGIVQHGAMLYAEASGAPLAVAPGHWTDGCPVLEERRWAEGDPDVVYRSFLDPLTGRALHVEVALAGTPRSFATAPRRWTAQQARPSRAA
jgi:N-methylhydantoinase B